MLDHDGETPARDFGKMFDLDRSTAIKNFVTRMEECMRQQQVAADDLKQVVSDATEAEFGPKDIRAMKRIAKWRLKDQLVSAKEELEALDRIGRAVHSICSIGTRRTSIRPILATNMD